MSHGSSPASSAFRTSAAVSSAVAEISSSGSSSGSRAIAPPRLMSEAIASASSLMNEDSGSSNGSTGSSTSSCSSGGSPCRDMLPSCSYRLPPLFLLLPLARDDLRVDLDRHRVGELPHAVRHGLDEPLPGALGVLWDGFDDNLVVHGAVSPAACPASSRVPGAAPASGVAGEARGPRPSYACRSGAEAPPVPRLARTRGCRA